MPAAPGAAVLVALLCAAPLRGADVALSNTYYVLKHLYEVTDGAAWLNNENWIADQDGVPTEPCSGSWMTSSHYDCFSGELLKEPQPICCQASQDYFSSVVKLDLYNNGLEGTIPEELHNLDYLRLLVMDGNKLSGTIPPNLGKLRYLEVLWLQDNMLSGTIPSELKDMNTEYSLSGEPGSIILRPNAFNCSILDAPDNDWCNKSLADLFASTAAPQGFTMAESADRGCIENYEEDEEEEEYAEAGVGAAKTSTTAGITNAAASAAAGEIVAAIVAVAVTLVVLSELVKRLMRRRARQQGRLTEEQKEADLRREQALHMVQQRQVEMARIEQDRLDLERLEEADARAGRASAAIDARRSARYSTAGARGPDKKTRASIFGTLRKKDKGERDSLERGRGRRSSICGGGAKSSRKSRPSVSGQGELPGASRASRASAGPPVLSLESLASDENLPSSNQPSARDSVTDGRFSGV